MYIIIVLICISLINRLNNFLDFYCTFGISVHILCLLKNLDFFFFCFSCWICRSYLYILDIKPLLRIYIFFPVSGLSLDCSQDLLLTEILNFDVHSQICNKSERLHFHFSLSCIGEGNGNPLQYSCLENPKDGGAWWAAVYLVTQSRTWLKRHSSRIGFWKILTIFNVCPCFKHSNHL